MKRALVLPAMTVLAVAMGLGGAIAAHAAGSGNGSGDNANTDALNRARQRSVAHDYSGAIVVKWRDGSGALQEQPALVRSHDGVVEIGDKNNVVAATRDRLLLDGSAWSTAPTAAVHGAPPLRAKYAVERSTGPAIAGMTTTVFDVLRARDHVLVERFFVAMSSGLVLRRVSYASDGSIERSLEFEKVWANANRAGLPPLSKQSAPSAGVRLVKDVEAPYRAPAHAGTGYRLVARWKHAGASMQLSYSDGLLSVSVFEQPGSLNWKTLASGGVATSVHGRPAVAYSLPIGEALVWQRGGIVYTAVGDAPGEDLAAVAEDVSRPVEDATMIRMARVVLAPFRW